MLYAPTPVPNYRTSNSTIGSRTNKFLPNQPVFTLKETNEIGTKIKQKTIYAKNNKQIQLEFKATHFPISHSHPPTKQSNSQFDYSNPANKIQNSSGSNNSAGIKTNTDGVTTTQHHPMIDKSSIKADYSTVNSTSYSNPSNSSNFSSFQSSRAEQRERKLKLLNSQFKIGFNQQNQTLFNEENNNTTTNKTKINNPNNSRIAAGVSIVENNNYDIISGRNRINNNYASWERVPKHNNDNVVKKPFIQQLNTDEYNIINNLAK